MARARNIKPGFFKNEALVELAFEYRLLFIGLWTLADRDGKLEDRPKKIKMELFAADDVNVQAGLTELERTGFIERYEAQGKRIVLIVNFSKHQSPHHTEKGSELPDRVGDANEVFACANGGVTVKGQKADGECRADSLNSDCLNEDVLNADCGSDGFLKDKKRKRSTVKTVMGQADLVRAGLEADVARQLLELRRRKRAPMSVIVWEDFVREAKRLEGLGMSLNDAARFWVLKSWQGFKAQWVVNEQGQGQGVVASAGVFKQSAIEQRNAQTVKRLIAQGVPDD